MTRDLDFLGVSHGNRLETAVSLPFLFTRGLTFRMLGTPRQFYRRTKLVAQ